MQILPTSNKSNSSWDDLNSSGNSGRDSFGFSQLFADHFNSSPAEITPTVDSIPVDTVISNNDDSSFNDIFATEAPYDDIESSRVDVYRLDKDIPLDQVRFTDNEIKQIISGLEDKGIDSNPLNSLLGSIQGVNIHDVIKAIAQSKPVKLTESNMMHIQNLAFKFDSSGELGKSMLADIRQGKPLQAWNRFSEALSNQSTDKVFSINKTELASLGKALGLDQSSLDAIHKSFGGKGELLLTSEGLKQVIVPLQQEMTNSLNTQNKLASQLEGILRPIISEARKRMELEASAGSHAEKRVQHSEILIRDSVTQKGINSTIGVEGEPNASLNHPSSNGKEKNTQSELSNSSQHVKDNNAAQNIKDSNTSQHVKDNNAVQNVKDNNVSQQPKDNNESFNEQKSSKTSADKGLFTKEEAKNPWEALIQRLDFQQPINTVSTVNSFNQQQAKQPIGWDRLTSKMFSQVDQGSFSSLRDGTSRLELQVNTSELGTVNILLTTKNGEVSALLRPERKEATTALVEQLDTLRLELEQKGLKVDKVDVQTQLNDGQNMHWNGTDQHNSFQQQQARSRDLERLRMLGKIRQEGLSTEISLAHNLQNRSITAGNTDRLNIVA